MTKSALSLCIALSLGAGSCLYAQEPQDLQAARVNYQQALEHGESAAAARRRYLSSLIQLRWRLVRATRQTPSEQADLEEGWKAVDAEMKSHLLPKSVDSRALSRRLLGRWRSPRHNHLYRRDGTWTMLPAYLQGTQSTHGRWRIENNQLVETYGDAPLAASAGRHAYTLILLTDSDWVYTDGEYVFYQTRLPR